MTPICGYGSRHPESASKKNAHRIVDKVPGADRTNAFAFGIHIAIKQQTSRRQRAEQLP